MADRRFDLSIDGVATDLHVIRFSSHEGISELFRCEVLFGCAGAPLLASDIVGTVASLVFTGTDEGVRQLNGMVQRLTYGTSSSHQRTYQCVIVPGMAKLQYRQHSRIFADQTVPDVVASVLGEAGVDCAQSLKETYPTHATLIQYRESDYDFLCRLLEYEGISFHFSHADVSDQVVLTDDATLYDTVGTGAAIDFRPDSGAMSHGESIGRFQRTQTLQVAKVNLDSYNFKNPELNLNAEASGAGDAALEIVDASVHYAEPALGTRRANLRLEQEQATVDFGEGSGAATQLVAGHLFSLAEHPSEDLNVAYLVTSLDLEGFDSAFGGGEVVGGDEAKLASPRFECQFRCVPRTTPYRPPRITPWPRMHGSVTARVVDPDGQELNTDEYGRVQVVFKFDANKEPVWARVATASTGKGWGFAHVPRVDEEVTVVFNGGSPLGEPIVTGSLYNGQNLQPFALPNNQTITGLQLKTVGVDEGNFDAAPPVHNALYFDDSNDAQAHVLNVAKDSTIQVANDLTETVFNDVTRDVKKNETRSVGVDETVTITGQRIDEVGGDETTTVQGAATRTVVGDDTTTIGGNVALTIGGTRTVEVADKESERLRGDCETVIDGASTLTVGGSHDVTSKSDHSHTIQKGATWTIQQSAKMTANQGVTIEVGGSTIEVTPGGITIKSSAPITIDGSSTVNVKAGATVKVEAGASAKVSAATVSLN
jgi:type VI secretion system secreted protein VgrG